MKLHDKGVGDQAGDASVRAALAEQGDDGSIPRHTLFYFYGGDLRALEDLATAQNYFVRPSQDGSGLIFEKTLAVDPASFESVAAQMQAWAQGCGSDYDGWECGVVGK